MASLGKILVDISHRGYYDTPLEPQEYANILIQHTTLASEVEQIRQAKENSICGRISSAHRILQELHQQPTLQFVPFETVQKDDVLAFINYETALFYRNVHDFTSCQNYLKISKLLAESSEIELLVDYQFATLRAEHNSDIELMTRFARIFQEKNMPIMEIMTHMRIGEIHAGLQEYEAARRSLLHSEQLIKDIHSSNLAIMCRSNLAFVYYLEGQYNQALEIFESIQDCPDYYQRSLILENIALIYEALDDHQTALNHWMDSLNLCQDHGVLVNIPEDSLRIGAIYEKFFTQHSQAKFFYKLGYDHSMQMFRDGINITGYMREVIEKYISYFTENYVPEEKPGRKTTMREPFIYALNKPWDEVRNIFHYNVIVYHKLNSKSIAEMLQSLKLKRSNFQAKQQKLSGLGFFIPDLRKNAKQMDQQQIVDDLQDYIDQNHEMTWAEINTRFEEDIFQYFVSKYGTKKEKLAQILKMSYPSLMKRLKRIM